MKDEQRESLTTAYQKINEALTLLLEKPMNELAGIGAARQAVVDAQNAVNKVISAE